MVEPNNQEDREPERRGGGWGIGCGLILLLGGGIMTLVTYFDAKPGESYYIFWGAMIVGALAIIGGLMKRR